MSDECLIKQETVVSFYIVYQAVMRKFTLADISIDEGMHSEVALVCSFRSFIPLFGIEVLP